MMKVLVTALCCALTGVSAQVIVSDPLGPCVGAETSLPYAACLSASDCAAQGGKENDGYGCRRTGRICCTTPPPAPAPAPSTGTGDDPWVEGLAGQHFFFKPKTPDAAWYAAISDPTLQVNLKLHSYDGVSEVDPERDFYTGATVQVFDEDGFAVHSLHIEVHDDERFDFQCRDLDASAPQHCLGGGALDVFVNGVRMLEPGHVHTGEGFDLSAANVIGSCQAVGDTQIRHQPELQQNRRLQSFDFGEFLLNRVIRNSADCERWIAATKRMKGGIFEAAGTKSTLRFATPHLTSVVEFDTHVPTDVSVMPMTYRIAYFVESFRPHAEGSEGFIGETSTLRYDAAGQPIMTGKVLKAADTMYRVDGPFGRDFEAKHM